MRPGVGKLLVNLLKGVEAFAEQLCNKYLAGLVSFSFFLKRELVLLWVVLLQHLLKS